MLVAELRKIDALSSLLIFCGGVAALAAWQYDAPTRRLRDAAAHCNGAYAIAHPKDLDAAACVVGAEIEREAEIDALPPLGPYIAPRPASETVAYDQAFKRLEPIVGASEDDARIRAIARQEADAAINDEKLYAGMAQAESRVRLPNY